MRLHLAHESGQNARIVHAAAQQRAVHNRTVEHLLRHRSDEPLQKRTARGVTGLQGHWTTWRKDEEGLRDIPTMTARGTIATAADQVAKWEATNHQYAVAVAQAAAKNEPIPRRVQRRRIDPRRLCRSRKREERRGRHRVRIDEGVRRIDTHTLQVPGIGTLTTKDAVPDDGDLRSCVVLQRTPPARTRRRLKPEERTFRIHASGRVPRPALKQPDEPGERPVGIDHGIAVAMTAVDDAENVTTVQDDLEQARDADHRIRRYQRRMNNCRPRSRRW